MAAWQFDFYIVDSEPQEKGLGTGDSPLLPLALVYDVQEELAHYMGPPWMMLMDWLVFGAENGNRIDILFQTESTASIAVRCDIREEAPQFLTLVSDLTRFHGYRFFSPLTREFIEPDLEILLNAIRGSQRVF